MDRELSDEQLATAVQRGETEQFNELVLRYQQKLLRYGRRFLSTEDDIIDIVQDVFLNAFKNIQSFDTTMRFSPWIYRIAHNAYVNELRRRGNNPTVFVDFDTFVSHPVYDDPVPKEREAEEIRRMIEKALDRLSPKYREVLILYYMEDMPYKEIADVLQVPTGTVGIRIKRAKESLREIYQHIDPQYGI